MGIKANEPELEGQSPPAGELVDRVGEASRESFPASDRARLRQKERSDGTSLHDH
jgi:hypothetical protein